MQKEITIARCAASQIIILFARAGFVRAGGGRRDVGVRVAARADYRIARDNATTYDCFATGEVSAIGCRFNR